MADVRPPDGAPTTPRAPAPARLDGRAADARASRRPTVPRSFQTRLTFAFIGVVALTLALVAPIVVNRIDDYFRQQEEQSLQVRANATAAVIDQFIETTLPGDRIVAEDDRARRCSTRTSRTSWSRTSLLRTRGQQRRPGRRRRCEFGLAKPDTDGAMIDRSRPGPLVQRPARHRARAAARPATPQVAAASGRVHDRTDGDPPWGMVVTLSNPYTSRASTLADDHRPAAGHGRRRVPGRRPRRGVPRPPVHHAAHPPDRGARAGSPRATSRRACRPTRCRRARLELRELSQQFNTMADRLEESVAIIRRDRDYSRDFLADVSHELRTPIAAMRTFIELLQGPAGTRPGRPDRVPRLLAPSSSTGSTGSPRTCSSSRSSTRGSCCSTCAPTTSGARSSRPSSSSGRRRSARASRSRRPCRRARSGSATTRRGSARSSPTSSATRSSSRSTARIDVIARQLPDGGAQIEVVDTGVGIAARPSCR